MAQDWGDAFLNSYQRSGEQYQRLQQFDREMKLREAADKRANEEFQVRIKGLRDAQNKQQTLDQIRAEVLKDQELGELDRPGTQRAQTAAWSQGIDYDSPSGAYDAAPALPEVRGGLPSRGKTIQRLAAAELEAGIGNANTYDEAIGKSKAYDKEDRRKEFFKKYKDIPDEELVKIPELRGLLNDNPKVKGSVGYDPKRKKYIVTDLDGGGGVESLSRSEILDAAMQRFDEMEGDADLAIARGRVREDRRYNRDRQGVQDQNAGMKTAHSMNMDETRTGIDAARLGLDRERLGLERKKADQSNWQIIGATPDNKGLLYFNRETRQTEAKPLPEGTDAKSLFRKITGAGGPMTKAQEATAVKDLVDAGMPLAMAVATVRGEDPFAGFKEALAGGAGAPAGGVPGPKKSQAAAPEYVPRPDSKVGQMRARNQEAAVQQQLDARVMAQRAHASAVNVLRTNDRAAAYQVQQMPGFALLDSPTKMAIHALVNSPAQQRQ